MMKPYGYSSPVQVGMISADGYLLCDPFQVQIVVYNAQVSLLISSSYAVLPSDMHRSSHEYQAASDSST